HFYPTGKVSWQVFVFLLGCGASFYLVNMGWIAYQELRDRAEPFHRGTYLMALPRKPPPHPRLRQLQNQERKTLDRYGHTVPRAAERVARYLRSREDDFTLRIYCMGRFRLLVQWRSEADNRVVLWWTVAPLGVEAPPEITPHVSFK